MWRLFCPDLFLISHSFGVSGELCFVIAEFPGYLHIVLLFLTDAWPHSGNEASPCIDTVAPYEVLTFELWFGTNFHKFLRQNICSG